MSTTSLNNINDFNENVIDNNDPRLVGYVTIDFFRIVDTDHTSRRIRDVALPVEHFYDYNLESNECNSDDNEEV